MSDASAAPYLNEGELNELSINCYESHRKRLRYCVTTGIAFIYLLFPSLFPSFPLLFTPTATMTRGNQRDVDRERAQRRNQRGVQNSTLKSREKDCNVVCEICRQTFMCTIKRPTLEQHIDSKHPKNQFQDCFPNFES